MSKDFNSVRQAWTEEARKKLVGRTVVSVDYLSRNDCTCVGWHESSVLIVFDDGTVVFPSQDDEGNGAGALFGQAPEGDPNSDWILPTIPVTL